jgi:type III restriction enzyme
MHDYVPDFIVRLNVEDRPHLILESKGYDPLEEVKREAAERWVAAVNADGTYGRWLYRMAKKVAQIDDILDSVAMQPASG